MLTVSVVRDYSTQPIKLIVSFAKHIKSIITVLTLGRINQSIFIKRGT
jgi:hypothetical protein